MRFSRRFHNLPVSKVRVTDPFWSAWQKTLCEETIPHIYKQLVNTGRIAHFDKVVAGGGEFEGLYFNDSDVYKWLEAASYALVISPNPETERIVDEVIAKLAAAQEPDGYLNTFFQLRHPNLKFRNLGALHEIYSIGHLVEAGCAHWECTGKRTLLDVAVKAAELIMSIFGPGKRNGYCGHEEFETALCRLADTVGDVKYRDYARWMVEQRGSRPSPFEAEFEDEESMAVEDYAKRALVKEGHYIGEYCQDHLPLRQHTDVVGHAVRAMYFYAGATQCAEGQDEEWGQALERVYQGLVQKRMYITAGVGPSANNEGFTTDYDLPNLDAYAETCAAIGLILWSQRMLEMTGESQYADVVEQGLYNGALSGISLDGKGFFYPNPLESRGNHERVPWFTCACCPPNIARLIGEVGSLAVGTSDKALWIHIPIGFVAEAEFAGVKVAVSATTDYPWGDSFTVTVQPERPVRFALRIRIPAWADDVSFEVADDQSQAEFEDGYAVFERDWKPGDQLTARWEMEPRWMESHPGILENIGKAALQRGPLLYCLEEADLKAKPHHYSADVEQPVQMVKRDDLMPGAVGIEVPGILIKANTADGLYEPFGTCDRVETLAPMIPYFAWANRGPNHMLVWLRHN